MELREQNRHDHRHKILKQLKLMQRLSFNALYLIISVDWIHFMLMRHFIILLLSSVFLFVDFSQRYLLISSIACCEWLIVYCVICAVFLCGIFSIHFVI